MPDLTATRIAKTFSLDDGERRGPMTIARLRFHPTAHVLLAQCADRRLGLWDLDATPQAVRGVEAVAGRFVCPHDAGWVRGFDVHPRGEWLATGGSDRHLKLWRWENGAPAGTAHRDVVAHEGWIEAVAYSPDGRAIATVGADRHVKVWDAATLQNTKSERAHANIARDVVFSPDGRWLITVGEDGVALVWDAARLEIARRIDTAMTSDQQGQTPALGGILRVSVSHDSRWLALAGDRQTMLYELSTGHGVAMIAQAGHDVLFGRRRNLLAAGEDSLKLWTFDPERFRPAAAPVRTDPRGARLPPNLPAFAATEITTLRRGGFSVGIAVNSDDSQFAAGKTDGKVDVYTLQ